MGGASSVADARDHTASALREKAEILLTEKARQPSETSEVLRQYVELYDNSEAGLRQHLMRFQSLMESVVQSSGAPMPLQETSQAFIEHAHQWLDMDAFPTLIGVFVNSDILMPGESDKKGYGLVSVKGDIKHFEDFNQIQDIFLSEGQVLSEKCINLSEVEEHVTKEYGKNKVKLHMLGIPIFGFGGHDLDVLSYSHHQSSCSSRITQTIQTVDSKIYADTLHEVPEEGVEPSEEKAAEEKHSTQEEIYTGRTDESEAVAPQIGAVMVFCQRYKEEQSSPPKEKLRMIRETLRLFVDAGGFLKQAVKAEVRQEQLQRSHQLLATSMDSSYLFNNTENVFRALQLYESYLQDTLSAEYCLVLLVDDTKMQLWRKMGNKRVLQVPISGDSIIGEVVTSGISMRTNKRTQLGTADFEVFNFLSANSSLNSELRSIMCVPIGSDVETFGVVAVFNKHEFHQLSWPKQCTKHQSLQGRGYSSKSLMTKVQISKTLDNSFRRSPVQMHSIRESKFCKFDEDLLYVTIEDLTGLIAFKYLDLIYMMQASHTSEHDGDDHLRSLLAMYDPLKRKINSRSAYGSSTTSKIRKEGSNNTLRSGTEDILGVLAHAQPDISSELAGTHSNDQDKLGNKVDCHEDELESWDCDVLAIPESQLDKCSISIFQMFHLHDYFQMKSSTLASFVEEVRKNYLPNPYHNFAHGFSVLLGSSMMLRKGCAELLKMDDILALLVGALCHDVGHPGTNNDFQVASGSSLALLYNDVSVLENFHASKTFKILQKDSCNILSGISERSKVRKIREMIIKAILSTDISKHFQLIDQLKTKYQAAVTEQVNAKITTVDNGQIHESSVLSNEIMSPPSAHSPKTRATLMQARRGTFTMGSGIKPRPNKLTLTKMNSAASFREGLLSPKPKSARASGASQPSLATVRSADVFDRKEFSDRMLLVEMIIHSADLSNPILRFDLYQGWTDLVVEEFYNQSLQEKALGLDSQPHMCNPPSDDLAKAKLQVSFIDFVVAPLWVVVQEIFPSLADRYETLENNRDTWKQLIREMSEDPGRAHRSSTASTRSNIDNSESKQTEKSDESRSAESQR